VARVGYNRGMPPVREVAAVMAKLGVIGFGGPAAHVALLRDETVARRQWVDEREFLDLFGAVSLLPGPNSTQLAIALGQRRAGWRGLVVAGLAFITPAMVLVLGLAWVYTRYGGTTTGSGVLYGVQPVVVAIIAVALRDLARHVTSTRWLPLLAVATALAHAAGFNALLAMLIAGVVAASAGGWRAHAAFALPVGTLTVAERVDPGAWAVLAEFLKLGVVVFGSGYVLVAFLQADLVDNLRWLTDQQVLDAVSAGQVTPGPVFTTATFLGYLIGGVPMALLATAAVFLPSFLVMTVLDPCVRAIRRSPTLGRALDGVTAGALGLMAAVTVELGRTAIDDAVTALLALAALVALARYRVSSVALIAAGAAVGVVHAFA
jgi:chromate transporter